MNGKTMIAGAFVALGTLAAADLGGPLAWVLAWSAVALSLRIQRREV